MIAKIYQKPFSSCPLDTLAMTVGCFYSETVAVLYAVLNHFIGTYAFRIFEDRDNPSSDQLDKPSVDPVYDIKRNVLAYFEYHVTSTNRTLINRPKLPDLGYSMRHWSGIRRDENPVAAHTAYILYVGRVRKFYRRNASERICQELRNRDYVK